MRNKENEQSRRQLDGGVEKGVVGTTESIEYLLSLLQSLLVDHATIQTLHLWKGNRLCSRIQVGRGIVQLEECIILVENVQLELLLNLLPIRHSNMRQVQFIAREEGG